MKNPLTSAGIEPATFRFVAQHLNHSATAVPGIHAKYPLFLLYFDGTLIFSTELRKILRHQISRKSVQWEPSCATYGRRHMAKLVSRFDNFANAPNGDHVVMIGLHDRLHSVASRAQSDKH